MPVRSWPVNLLFLTLLLPPASARAQQAKAYQPCLGCAEHREILTRWHRPFLLELGADGALAAAQYHQELVARGLGMCESDPLLRGPSESNGCHPFSLTRALLLATPLELVVFTSPAWGLARRGHPRWALAWEMIPTLWHAIAWQQTLHATHVWQQQVLLR